MPAVQIFDASGHVVTPAGARWSLHRATGGWWLELRLDDAALPVPYTIDPAVTTVTFAGSPQTGGARSMWTVGFTTSATGSLVGGNTITVNFGTFPTVPATPTILLGSGFANCTATATGSTTTVTITLVGSSCTLPASTPVTLSILGITNPAAGSIPATNFSVTTTADSTAANPAGPVVIAAATAPTAGQAAASSLSLGARTSWVLPFTTSSTGALRAGDTITATFTAGFNAANVTTAALGTGFANCSATVTGVGTVATVVLADSGGVCSLPASSAASLTIAGVVNGATLGAVQPTVKTSADTTAVAETAATMVAATTPNSGGTSASSLAINARASWNLTFTPSATGSLRAGDTITVTFTAGFNTANVTTVSLSPRFINCSATVTGVGTVATVVLADSGGVCVLTPSVVAITIAGVINGSTTGAVAPTLKTSVDTTAVTEGSSTMVAAGTPTAGQAAASNLSLGARASWTTPFTTSATGALRTGDTITVTYTAGFNAANVTTATLGTGFINCSATVTGVGTVATVVLANSGGICSLPISTAASLTIAGVVNGATTGAVQPTVKTSADTTAVSETAATMVGASTPTAGQAAASNLNRLARASWTTPFTSSANGSLRTGDTITVTYTAGFSAANVTTVTLGTGFVNCSATVTGAGTVATVVLADSGGVCSLPASTVASLTIAGVVNGNTSGTVQPTVKTSADTTAVSETGVTMVVATTPTAGQAAASNLSLGARASWTTPFTSSNPNGSLRAGDTITVTYTAGFNAANVTTATLGVGFINCSATVTGVGAVATVVLANSGGICSLPASTVASLTIAGVVNGSTTGTVQPTVKTSADTTAVSETGVTMVAATAPTAVTVSSTSLAAGARANWTANFTTSANGALRTGDSIVVTFAAGFDATNVTTATLGAGFVNCSATVSGVGTVATVVLADNGGTCALPASTAASLIIAGMTEHLQRGLLHRDGQDVGRHDRDQRGRRHHHRPRLPDRRHGRQHVVLGERPGELDGELHTDRCGRPSRGRQSDRDVLRRVRGAGHSRDLSAERVPELLRNRDGSVDGGDDHARQQRWNLCPAGLDGCVARRCRSHEHRDHRLLDGDRVDLSRHDRGQRGGRHDRRRDHPDRRDGLGHVTRCSRARDLDRQLHAVDERLPPRG